MVGIAASSDHGDRPPAATQLDITTIETACGGVNNPDLPPCHTGPVSRLVQVIAGHDVVAAGTTGHDGSLVLVVPSGELVVTRPDAEPYMNCDGPDVTAVAGRTTPVTQTCTRSRQQSIAL